MRSDYLSWSVAIVMSLLLHSLMFLNGGAQMGVDDVHAIRVPTITRLNFKQVTIEPVPEVKRQIENKIIEPVKTPATDPVVVKKKIAPIEPLAEVEPVRQVVTTSQNRGEQTDNSSDDASFKKRQQYLHELMRHIESYKYYPRAARKRAVEGSVKLSFVLRDDGRYEQLVLDSGEPLLRNAAQVTLESALPFPLPVEEIGLSRHIEFIMMYSLSD